MAKRRLEIPLFFLLRPCWLTSRSRPSRTTATVVKKLGGEVQREDEEAEEEGEEKGGVVRLRVFPLL